MNRRVARVLCPLAIAALALALGAGCPAPTIDADGVYEICYGGCALMPIRIEINTAFPSTTCTGTVQGAFPSPHADDYFAATFSAGTISAANEVSFEVSSGMLGSIGGTWTCTAVDYDGDAVADALEDCVIGDYEYTLTDPIPRVG